MVLIWYISFKAPHPHPDLPPCKSRGAKCLAEYCQCVHQRYSKELVVFRMPGCKECMWKLSALVQIAPFKSCLENDSSCISCAGEYDEK